MALPTEQGCWDPGHLLAWSLQCSLDSGSHIWNLEPLTTVMRCLHHPRLSSTLPLCACGCEAPPTGWVAGHTLAARPQVQAGGRGGERGSTVQVVGGG